MTDLEEWANKMKLALTDSRWMYIEGWDALGRATDDLPDDVFTEQAAALLADRDAAAAGLIPLQRTLLRCCSKCPTGYVRAYGWWRQSITHLCGRGLLERCESIEGEPTVRLTAFGRSVARKEQEI